MKHLILIILFSACTPAIQYQQIQTKLEEPNFTILHTLTSEEGLGVRGTLVEFNGRLYGLAGERGPNGSPNCSSTANWNTVEHINNCPGSLFSLKLDGTDFKVEHAFSRLDSNRRNSDGYHPYGSLVVGTDHRLYGVAQVGGSPLTKDATSGADIPGFGTLFAYSPKTGEFETLHHFFSEQRAFDGMYPMGGVTVDEVGSVYGIAKDGGDTALGTVWRWGTDESFMFSPLPGYTYGGITLANGLLHGATWTGGKENTGVYFTVDPVTLHVTVVDSFPPFSMNEHGTDNTPIQEPITLSNHQIVMSREFGGFYGTGIIVSLDPSSKIKVLKSMEDIPLGADPRFSNSTGGMLNGRMTEGPDGLIYGVAQYGGAFGTGGIFRIARNGSLFQLLYSFPDAAYPYGGVITGSDGAIYGTTFVTGTIWRFTPPSTSCL